MNKILCAGNRYCPDDSFGPLVYDHLLMKSLPSDVEVIDGGLAGIDLLHHFETANRVVVVDRIHGFGEPDKVHTLLWDEFIQCNMVEYGHSEGLQYLLLCLPALGITPQVEVILVGMDGLADSTAIASGARMALEALNG